MRTPCALLLCLFVTGNSAAQDAPDLSRHFKGIQGTFVLLDGQTGKVTRYNPERAARRFAPCSTFKIPNTAIALESGVAPDPDFTLAYDPALKQQGDWSRDHSLRSAFKFSVVWYYQEIARRVGSAAMNRFVHQFGYGNEDTSGGIDRFWLGSTLGISSDEQVRFLEKLYKGRLGLSARTTGLVKEIMIADQTSAWRLSGKTGACREEGEDVVLWYVGFVERGSDVYYFALEMGDREYKPLYSQRITKVRAILTDLGILAE